MSYTTRRLARKTNWATMTPAEGQIVYDKTKKSARIGDGVTVGGRALGHDNRTQILTPNQLNANANDFAPTGLKDAGCIILSADADHDLTGISAAAFPDGVEDRVISIGLDSTSPGNVTIKDESANSAASNRFKIGRDIKLVPGSIQSFRYRADLNRWFFFGAPATALTFTPAGTLAEVDVQSAIENLARRAIHVISIGTTAPPSTPARNDAYVVGAGASGAWASQDGKIAVCMNAAGPVWSFLTPANDVTLVYNRAEGAFYRYTSSTWSAIGAGINDSSVQAVKLDTSTASKRKAFRSALQTAPMDAVGALNLFSNGNFEGGGSETAAAAITLTASGTLQSAQIVDGVSVEYRGSFVASAQKGLSIFSAGAFVLGVSVTLGQASLGVNDELSCVLKVTPVQAAKLLMGTANAQPQSLGFWFYSVQGGTFSGSIRNSTKTRSYPFSFTVAAATRQWISLTDIIGDTAVSSEWAFGTGMLITICLAAGNSRVGAAGAWAGANYSGVTGTTNGVATTGSDRFFIGGVICLAGDELPDSARAGFALVPRNEFVRTDDQALSAAQKAKVLANLGLGTSQTAALGADVNMTDTNLYFDGPSVNVGNTGTWFVVATITVRDTGAAANYAARLHDGTTTIASAVTSTAAVNAYDAITLMGVITNPVGALRISARDFTATTGVIRANASLLGKDTTITAVRLA